jgi:hypothetical protein
MLDMKHYIGGYGTRLSENSSLKELVQWIQKKK